MHTLSCLLGEHNYILSTSLLHVSAGNHMSTRLLAIPQPQNVSVPDRCTQSQNANAPTSCTQTIYCQHEFQLRSASSSQHDSELHGTTPLTRRPLWMSTRFTSNSRTDGDDLLLPIIKCIYATKLHTPSVQRKQRVYTKTTIESMRSIGCVGIPLCDMVVSCIHFKDEIQITEVDINT